MSSRPAILAALGAVALAIGGGGCLTAADSGAEVPTDASAVCAEDLDCVLAGPSCCACPTYALPGASGFADACMGVDCPLPSGCAPLVARCDDGTCMAECAPATCDLSCPTGFAIDATGCLACACAGATPEVECMADTDCARAPADCCGCDRGGHDTAVPVSRLGDHLAELMCFGGESCPGVSTCASGAEPRCVVGRCTLITPATEPGGPPADACGRPDLPPCPAGQVCVINASDQANPLGLGVCRPPS